MAAESSLDGVTEHLVCNLIIKVSGNNLCLNPEVMKLIEDEKQDNIPVVVLSVVGQPKSGKTSVMNSVLKQFGESCPVPKNLFPFTTDDDSRYSELKGEEGVLLWKYPTLVAGKEGIFSAWYFMDIWIEHPRTVLYTRLVDFCLSMSSVVIYSEPCIPSRKIYWQPCDSRLQLTINNFRNALQLHLFLQTDESPPVICQMAEGLPNEVPGRTEFNKALASVVNAANFLTNRCKCITSTCMPLDDGEQNKSVRPVKWGAIKQILDLCYGNPLEINNQVVHIANLSYWIQQGMVLINGNISRATKNSEIAILGTCTGDFTPSLCLQSLPCKSLPDLDFEPEKVDSETDNFFCNPLSPVLEIGVTDEDIEMMETWDQLTINRTHEKEENLSSESTSISQDIKSTSLEVATLPFSEDRASLPLLPCKSLPVSNFEPEKTQVINETVNVFCNPSSPLLDIGLTTEEEIEMIETCDKPNPLATHGKEENLSSKMSESSSYSGNMKSTSLEVPTMSFSENHTSYKALTKFKVPLTIQPDDDATNILRQMSKYYFQSFEALLEDPKDVQVFFEDTELFMHHNALSEDILQKLASQECSLKSQSVISTKLSELFQEFRNLNNTRKSNFKLFTETANTKLNELVDKVAKQLQQQLSRNISRFFFKFDPLDFEIVAQELTSGPHFISKKLVKDTVVSASENFHTVANKMNALVDTYVENFETLYRNKICLEPSKFENYHNENLANAKYSTNYVESGRKKLDILCVNVLENHKNRFQQLNYVVYGHEERISKDAYDHATEKYKTFMDQKISSAVLTDTELKNIHFFATTTISKLFLSVLPVHQTQPWIEQHSRLDKSLTSLLPKYRQKNQNHLKKLELAKNEGFNTGKNHYQEVMERLLPDTKVSDSKFNEFDRMASHEANLRFKEKVAHVHSQIYQLWEAEFKAILVDLKQRYAVNNQSNHKKPLSYSAALRHNTVVAHQRPTGHVLEKPYGVGLYMCRNKICVGVYVNGNFAANMTYYEPPIITFTDGRVIIGEEAQQELDSNSNTDVYCYNIFSILQDHKNIEIDVCISGSKKKLGREEILTIYFHRIRMNTEVSLNQILKSCYVVATGLLTGEAKQMLKTCLKISGFQKVSFIPCTTAMAISYVLKGDGVFNQASSIVLAYVSSNVVEVATADVAEGQVIMKTLTGDTNINIKRGFPASNFEKLKGILFRKLKIEKRIKNILDVAVSPQVTYERIILCYGNTTNPSLRQTLYSQLTNCCGLKSFVHIELNYHDIVGVAAALDELRNQHSDLHSSQVNFPSYSNISPYMIQVKIGKKPSEVFADFNSCTSVVKNYPSVSFWSTDILVQEIGRDSQKEWPVAEYEFEITGRPAMFELTLNEETNLTVNICPKIVPVNTKSRALVASECQRIAESLKQLLGIEESNHGIELQVGSTMPEQTSQVAVVGSGSSIDDVLSNSFSTWAGG